VVVRLGVEETRELLQEVPRLYGTQITEVLLWALVQALGDDVVVEVEGHGREELEGAPAVDLTRTVGWFTTLYPLAFAAEASLAEVREQVRAVPQRGIGYGLLRLRRRLREGELARVSFNYLGQVDNVVRTGTMYAAAPEPIGNGRSGLNERGHELEVNASVRGGEMSVSWTYSRVVHERAEIERIAERYLGALRQLLDECRVARAAHGYSTADFPLAQLDQDDLDALMEQLA
jgi:non-ribosomal peptide synthase protein (TIGR01720 family)